MHSQIKCYLTQVYDLILIYLNISNLLIKNVSMVKTDYLIQLFKDQQRLVISDQLKAIITTS